MSDDDQPFDVEAVFGSTGDANWNEAGRAATVDGSGEGAPAPEATRKERRRLRAIAKLLIALLLLPLVAIGGAKFWYDREIDRAATDGKTVIVTIKEGAGTADIADELERKRVIESALAFKVYVRLHNPGSLKFGEYTMREEMGVQASIETLRKGPRIESVVLKVLPGLWLSEVAEAVSEQLGLDAQKFIEIVKSDQVRSKFEPADVHTTEGLLYPDTYRFPNDERLTELAVVQRLVKRFDSVADSIYLDTFASNYQRSPYDVVKVAAMVQLEVRKEDERPLVASVIYNRLAIDMKLQIDATVLYAIQQRKPSNTELDRQTDSFFNTYRYKGLGPNPIATTSKQSLLAALRPADTKFFYYVLIDKDGTQAFAQTYEQHLVNVQEARDKDLL